MKKYFFILFLIIFLFPISVQAFSDVDDSENEVYFLFESDVVQGRAPGQYLPEADVNRAEMLKILLESAGISPDPESYKNCFPDVQEEWFAPYVCYAQEHGMIQGYPDGMFKPGITVNLAEALKMSFYAFDQEFEAVEGEWYSGFLEVARNYKVADESMSPSALVSRKLMAQLAVRTGVIGMTNQAYNSSDLDKIRRWKRRIQDFSSPVIREAIRTSLELGGESATVKITAIGDQEFKFEYGHDTIIAGKGASDLDQDPTIEVRENSIQFGLNADRRWDGRVTHGESESVLEADADLTGLYGASINLRWIPRKSMVISDKFGEEVTEIGSGTSFPYSVCVSDFEGYAGGITVLSMSSVELGACPDASKYIKPTPEQLARQLRGAWKIKPKKKIKPQPPGGQQPAGAEDDGGDEVDEGEDPPAEAPFKPTTDTKQGLGTYEEIPQAPWPNKHPGKNPPPANGYAGLEGAIEGLEERNAGAAETAAGVEEVLDAIIGETEAAFEEYGIKKPGTLPQFDPGTCCPGYSKEGKCCTDLDLGTAEGRAEYQKRLRCLADAYNENQAKLQEQLENARQFAKDAKDLERMEANFAQLAAALKLNKIMAHTVIDVATGQPQKMSDAVSTAISNAFGDLEAAAFDGIHDPGSMPGNFAKVASDAAANILSNELLDYQNGVKEAAGNVADTLQLSGPRRDAFIRNAMDKFGNDPSKLLDPNNWAKLIYDSMLDEAGSAAENVVKHVKKLREDRDANYLAAWNTAHLMKQINETLKKVRTEDCSKKFVEELKKEVKKRKEAWKKYHERRAEDFESIRDMINWILEYKMESLVMGDNPDPEVVKQAVLKELERQLCLIGFDICWVDLDFDVTWVKDADGTMRWSLTLRSVKPRQERKEPCDCPLDKALSEDEAEAQSQESGGSETSGSEENTTHSEEPISSVPSADITPDEDLTAEDSVEVICCYCDPFDPEVYEGRVLYDHGLTHYVTSDECQHEIPEHRIFDRLEEAHPGEAPLYMDSLMMPENEGVEFDLLDGKFYDDGQEVNIIPF
jgi:hypothetical protein